MKDYLPLAEQLKILFDRRPHPSRRMYTLQEVSAQTGVSLATVSQMRSGRSKNPQLNTMRTIARFFGIPLRYFETTSADECYALLKQQWVDAPPSLNEIAFRASVLSEKSQQDILTLIKWVQAAEKQNNGDDLPSLPTLSDDEIGEA